VVVVDRLHFPQDFILLLDLLHQLPALVHQGLLLLADVPQACEMLDLGRCLAGQIPELVAQVS
jgi:hypothetical protein